MRPQLDENDLVLVVWSNTSSEQGRPFETMTKHESRTPIAWRLSFLQTKYAAVYKNTHLVSSEEDLKHWISINQHKLISREEPLLIPVKYARSVLGWKEYTVWEDEHTSD